MDVDVYGSSSRFLGEAPLPASVVSVLPQDPCLQLDLAHKIVCNAYSSQVSRLEEEAQQLRGSFKQHQSTIRTLERRVDTLERELLDQQEQAKAATQEQDKLLAEKTALIETVKRLNREVAKLEQFKRSLLQQLQDDEEDSSSGHVGTTGKQDSLSAVDLTTERLVAEVLHSAHTAAAASSSSGAAYTPLQRTLGSGGSAAMGREAAAVSGLVSPGRGTLPRGEQLSPSRYGSTSYTQQHAVRAQQQPPPLGGSAPLQQPSLITQFGASSLKGPLGATAQQQLQHHQQQQSQSQLSPPRLRPGALSAPSSAASTPAAPSASSPRVEGKEFFRQARAQLSYEQFSAFLGSIKELNAGRATREDTLQTARELFGVANSHLYGLFEALLSRHLTAL